MTLPLLELISVGKTYPMRQGVLSRLLGRQQDHVAIDDVSLSVPRGGGMLSGSWKW